MKRAAKLMTLLDSGTALPAWITAGGIAVSDWAVAHDAKAAANLTVSYKNLVNPGTNDITVGVAPTWDATNGWKFNGSTQYLSTIIIPTTYSLVIKFSNYDGANFMFGAFEGSAQATSVNVSGVSMQVYWQASNCLNAPVMTSGILTINSLLGNGAEIYRNGVKDSEKTGAGGTNTTVPSYVGCVNYPGGGGAYGYAAVYVQALGILKREFTPSEIAALVAAL